MNLSDNIESAFRLTPAQNKALKKLNLKTLRDLLFHFPSRYDNLREIKKIKDLVPKDRAIIYGKISKLKTRKAWKRKIPLGEAVVTDETGSIKVIWFNQPYIAKMFPEGSAVKLRGAVSSGKKGIYLANPEIEHAGGVSLPIKDSLFEENTAAPEMPFIPVYPESRGVTSRFLYHSIKKVLSGEIGSIEETIPAEILRKYHLPGIQAALVWIHSPREEKEITAARKRFSFEQVFLIQIAEQKRRAEYGSHPAFIARDLGDEMDEFLSRFPFEPTAAQKRALEEIVKDLGSGRPMMRLLEGDVGSGKTLVAAAAAYAIVSTRPDGNAKGGGFGNLQVAYMAPTEILAKQHFESFMRYFSYLPIQIGLITGSGCKKFPSKTDAAKATDISRAQLLSWVKNGEIPILIGTHAIIQKSVSFKHLALSIIDEQHRFGVSQRMALARGHTQTKRGLTAEKTDDSLLYRDLTYRVRQALFEVKKQLGSGHKESVYGKALEEEFKRIKLSFSKEVRIPVLYRGKNVGTYVPDFVIENKIVMEIKSLPFVGSKEKKQLWTYLKGSLYRLGLLINFNSSGLTIDRIIYDNARDKESASDSHGSALVPHLLSMTATPIPRTLALTIYGDLDLTLLDEMPEGRKKVITEIVPPEKRGEVYEKIREELEAGRQAYVICPRIDLPAATGAACLSEARSQAQAGEPDQGKELALYAKSVKAEEARLKKDIFPKHEIAILHSKMRDKEKEGVMKKFSEGKTDILVATSMVEVGVNVENATVIIIEGAERFGLSQLHQLRGRVLRSSHQAYCFLFSETKNGKSNARLKAIKNAKNGFELAEKDLEMRGAGELGGGKQWGLSDMAMEAIKNIKMVEAARESAKNIIALDPELKHYPVIKKITENAGKMHFE